MRGGGNRDLPSDESCIHGTLDADWCVQSEDWCVQSEAVTDFVVVLFGGFWDSRHQALEGFRAAMIGNVTAAIAAGAPQHSGFLYACVTHCGQFSHDDRWATLVGS